MKSRLIWVKSMVIAAIYTALTVLLGMLSYGELQFRLSDAMIILPLLPRLGIEAIIGLTVGGFLGNITSPFQPWDLIFGPITNFFASLVVYLVGRKVRSNLTVKHAIGSITASVIIAVMVGFFELHLVYELPLITVAYVLISELIVIGVVGYMVLRSLERYFVK
ncbi:MAG: QueT transporter family protein [Thermosphaera sp.]